ncbi:MAG: c-type cytochrome [Betaproteobacteria bacterium]
MKHSSPWPQVFRSLAIIAGAAFSLSVTAQVNVEEAKNVFKDNDCRKCHSPDKAKGGPSLKKIAEKYKGKPDAEQKLIKHMTQGPRVKLENGKEEDHKLLDSNDPKVLKNVARWILSH